MLDDQDAALQLVWQAQDKSAKDVFCTRGAQVRLEETPRAHPACTAVPGRLLAQDWPPSQPQLRGCQLLSHQLWFHWQHIYLDSWSNRKSQPLQLHRTASRGQTCFSASSK